MVELPFVRSSERGAFKQCPQKWYWSYVDRLVPKGAQFDERDFGTGIHICMAEHYVPGTKRGRPLLETWEEFTTEYQKAMKKAAAADKSKDWGEVRWTDLYNLGVAVLKNYEAEYQGDPHWDVIAAENTFSANIANKAIDVGTIDLVVRDLNRNKIIVVDHKTANGFPDWRFLNLDDQGGSYVSLARHILLQQGKIGPKERLAGMEFNYIRKAYPDERPVNEKGQACNKPLKEHFVATLGPHFAKFGVDPVEAYGKPLEKMSKAVLEEIAEEHRVTVLGDVSKVQPAEILHREFLGKTSKQRSKQLSRVIDDMTVMKMAREGDIPILKAPGKLCGWCDFYDLCLIDENMDDVEHFKKVAFTTRDPYHDHREGAVNSKLTVAADKGLKHGG